MMKYRTDIPPREITERVQAGEMSRREFHRVLAAAGIAVVATPLVSRTALAAASDQGNYFTWGGYDIPELFAPYIEKHGEAPNFAAFGGAEEALTKLMGGFVVDVAHPCNADLPRWMASGLFRPIEVERLSNWDDVVPALKNLQGAVRDGETYFVPSDWGQTSITYREDLFDLQGEEESWGMLWDERYSGRLGVIASADTWWCAAILAGVEFQDMTTDENFQKITALLREQRPLIRMYTDDMTTLEQALASGELVAAMTWNSSPVELKRQGLSVRWANPKEGALTWVCGAMMHKDAPNPDRAHDIIDSLISVDSGRFIIDEYGYGHSNTKSFDAVGDERLAELGLTRNPSDLLDAGKFAIPVPEAFTSKMTAEFEQIKAGF